MVLKWCHANPSNLALGSVLEYIETYREMEMVFIYLASGHPSLNCFRPFMARQEIQMRTPGSGGVLKLLFDAV